MSKQAASPLRLVRAANQRDHLALSEQQRDAVAHRGCPLIISGATGTGKTTTLIHAAVDRIKAEPLIDPAEVARAVLYMASLPLHANVANMTIMATAMPFVGRG